MSSSVANKEMKLVVFSLNNKEYALNVQFVRSIEKMMHITRVPNVEYYIKGVINLRGVITPVIDLRSLFQIEENPNPENTIILIVSLDDKEIGLIVDEANDVINIKEDDIEPQPDVIGNEKQQFIEGVIQQGERLLILLKLENIYSSRRELVQK